MRHYIYGLLDPDNHFIRYVGQTAMLESRFRAHCGGRDSCTREWIAQLAQRKQKPVLCILELIEQEEWVPVPDEPLFEHQPFDPHGLRTPLHRETVWLKRFRKTILNRKARDNSSISWDWLVNPDAPPSLAKKRMGNLRLMRAPVITIFVRHSANCPHRTDETFQRCDCPKHLRWTLNGKQHRQKAGTRSWNEAELRKRQIEERLTA
jgi:hypothetical protein